MLVHFMSDDTITTQLMDNFEEANPKQNLFLIFRDKPSDMSIYEKHIHCTKEFLLNTSDINEIFDQLTNVKGIVLHALPYENAQILEQLKHEYSVVWLAWGYDIYFLPKIRPYIYAHKTLKYAHSQNPSLRWKWIILKNNILRNILYEPVRQILSEKLLDKARKKIKYFAGFVEGDFEILQKNYPSAIQFYYHPLLSIYQYVPPDLVDKRVDGNNIMLGNSAAETGNHLDIFDSLKSSSQAIEASKIYIPLSYGGTSHYVQTVIKKGKENFGEQCIAIQNKMPLTDYVKIMLSCSTGIFYHFRQKAMGNIIAMFWLGARVYMSSKSPAYCFFKSKGIIVFDLDSDFDKYGVEKLEDAFVEKNRQILWTLFSPETVNRSYKKLIAAI
jgi:hypothetical protein